MADQEKRKGGRPLFEPSKDQRNLVTILHAHGFSIEFMRRKVQHTGERMSVATFKRAFRNELRDAHSEVKANMIGAVVRAGLKGNVGAQRYWLQTQGGPEWRVSWSGDPDAPPPSGITQGTTIIVQGGLAPVVYQDDPAGQADASPLNGSGKPNGKGTNGSGHPA